MITDREAQIASLQAMLENNVGQHRQILKQFDFNKAKPKSEFFIFLGDQSQRRQAAEIQALIDELSHNGIEFAEARKCLKEWLRY